MFTLRQASVKIAVLLHKQAKVPFVLSLAVHTPTGHTYSYWFQSNKKTKALLPPYFILPLSNISLPLQHG